MSSLTEMLCLLLGIEVLCDVIGAARYCPALCHCDGNKWTCRQVDLTSVPLQIHRNTVALDVGENCITQLQNVTFARNTNLQSLSLESNRISHIESNTFTGLKKLRTLNLRNNEISYVVKGLFATNRKLEVLDLSQNTLHYLPGDAVRYLFNLRVLNVSHNQISSAHLDHNFRFTTHLQHLDLSHNNIPQIEDGSFSVTRDWASDQSHVLNLSNCNILFIQDRTFSDLTSLTGLSLSDNHRLPATGLTAALNDLPANDLELLTLSNVSLVNLEDILRDPKFSRLRRLDLSRNFLSTIEANAFDSVEALRELDVSHNLLVDIQGLDGLLHLRLLDVSHNALTSAAFLRDDLAALQRLRMAGNQFTELRGADFENLYDLRYLDMSDNRIARVVIENGFEYLASLHLSHNRLQDVSFINRLPQLTDLDLSHNRVTFVPGDTFRRAQSLRSIDLSNNQLNRVDSAAFDLENLQSLDISHNSLQEVVQLGWQRSLRHLYLHHNNISFFAPNALDGLSNLVTLDVSHCGLYGLMGRTFDDLHKLTTLNVSHNHLGTFLQTSRAQTLLRGKSQLKSVDASFCELTIFPASFNALKDDEIRSIDLGGNYISQLAPGDLGGFTRLATINLAQNQFKKLDPQHFNQATSLKSVNISHNPLLCSCDLQPLCDWLASTHVTVVDFDDIDAYVCRHADKSASSLAQYCTEDISQKCTESSSIQLWIVIAVVVTVTSVVSLCVAVLLFKYCRNRQRQKSKARKCRDIAMQRQLSLGGGGSKGETQKMMPDTSRYICDEFTYKSDML